MNDMLQNKRYDGHLLTSAVWRDPERAGEQYTPIYCDYFKTLFDHATSSSTSGAALLKNPLAGLVEELDSFLQDHSHEVPKIGLQIRDSLCGHDAARCGYPAHYAAGRCPGREIYAMPPLSYPTCAGYDALEDKMKYNQWHAPDGSAQQAAVADPMADQVVERVPSEVLLAKVDKDLAKW